MQEASFAMLIATSIMGLVFGMLTMLICPDRQELRAGAIVSAVSAIILVTTCLIGIFT